MKVESKVSRLKDGKKNPHQAFHLVGILFDWANDKPYQVLID
jgi:hypothetical protein